MYIYAGSCSDTDLPTGTSRGPLLNMPPPPSYTSLEEALRSDYIINMHILSHCSIQFIKRRFIICQSLPRGILVKFNSNDFKNSAADDVLRKFMVVILPVTSFLYLFSFIGKLHVFAMD